MKPETSPNRRIGFRTMRARLSFWLLVVALLPLAWVAILSTYHRYQGIKEREFRKLIAIRDLKVEHIHLWLNERCGDIRAISRIINLRDVEGLARGDSLHVMDSHLMEAARALLKEYLEKFPDYSEIFIINPRTGRVMVSTDRRFDGDDRSDRPYFKDPLDTGEPRIHGIYYSGTLKTPTLTFSIPIQGHQPQSHAVGILVTRVDLNHSLFPLLLRPTGMGNTGECLLVNQDQIVLNELRGHANAPLRLRIDAQPAALAAKGKTGIVETEDYRNVRVLAAYTFIPGTGWGFVVKEDLSQVYQPIYEMLRDIGILVALAAALAYLLARILSGTIARPIRHMAEVAGRIGEGDLAARNRVETHDEIGFLAGAFNTMADRIALNDELRQIDAEITQTLVDAKDLEEFRVTIVKKLVQVTGSQMGAYFVFNRKTRIFEPFFSIGLNPDLLQPMDADRLQGELGLTVENRQITRITDIPEDSVFRFRTFTGEILPKEMISIPIIIDSVVSGVVSLAGIKPYPQKVLEIMKLPWTTSFGTALSNMWANAETARLAKELKAANQQLQAQAEELHAQSQELRQNAEELRAQNEELEAQKAQVESANRLKSEFLSNMSHELRTPLNSVMALSRALSLQARDRLTQEERGYIEIIERNGRDLLALINDLLDLAKIEAGRMEVHPHAFSVRETVLTIIEQLAPLAKEKGIRLCHHLSGDLPLIESDEKRVYHILQNLIANALKFTHEGEVAVSASADDRCLSIHVTDTGIGISPQDLPYIFEEFRQADGSASRNYGGTGLGLAIVRKTARLIGGEVSVESRVGKGSTFTFTVPLAWQGVRPAADSRLVVSEPHRAAGKTGKRRVLLIEDNEAAIVQVRGILAGAGYHVDVARGGQEALDYMEHTVPDGIILDLMMPGVDGFAVLEAVRGKEATARLPVLILTAKDLTREDLRRLSSNNIRYLIQKGDVDREGLLLKTAQMLGVT